MSTLSKTKDGICLSIQAYARELKCCRKRLGEKVKATGLKPARTGPTGYPTYKLADIVEMLINEALQKAAVGGDPDQWSPRDRLDHFRAENEKLKLQKAQREVVPVDEISTMLATVFKSLTLSLETMPDVIERDVGLTGNQVDAMQRVIDGQREMLYTDLKAAINA